MIRKTDSLISVAVRCPFLSSPLVMSPTHQVLSWGPAETFLSLTVP